MLLRQVSMALKNNLEFFSYNTTFSMSTKIYIYNLSDGTLPKKSNPYTIFVKEINDFYFLFCSNCNFYVHE